MKLIVRCGAFPGFTVIGGGKRAEGGYESNVGFFGSGEVIACVSDKSGRKIQSEIDAKEDSVLRYEEAMIRELMKTVRGYERIRRKQ